MSQRLWSKDFIFVTIVNLFMYLIQYMMVRSPQPENIGSSATV